MVPDFCITHLSSDFNELVLDGCYDETRICLSDGEVRILFGLLKDYLAVEECLSD